MKKVKRNLIHVMICVGLLCLIWGGYALIMQPINKLNEDRELIEQSKTVDYKILKTISDVQTEGKKITLSGWALRLNSSNKDIQIVLKQSGGSEAEVMETKCVEDEQVGAYFQPGWDFGKSGFVANIDKKDLKKNVCYEVFVVLSYEEESETDENSNKEFRKKLSMNRYLYNENLYDYNPLLFEKPEIQDDELLRVIDNGSVLQYSSEYKFWIYQYEGMLYYFLDSAFGSMKENNIGIPVIPYTSRKELLPEDKPENDYLGFFFEDEKFGADRVGKYQVVSVSLPTNYPIVYMTTGLYDNTAKRWVKDFYIDVRWNELQHE